jgi:hypothetical protein
MTNDLGSNRAFPERVEACSPPPAEDPAQADASIRRERGASKHVHGSLLSLCERSTIANRHRSKCEVDHTSAVNLRISGAGAAVDPTQRDGPGVATPNSLTLIKESA